MQFPRNLPHFATGPIVKGFGRGSKELGIPTANFPLDVVQQLPVDFATGIYFGWASVDHGAVHRMVMSIGWNPYYHNQHKSMETHILHDFGGDFYGSLLKVCICGFIRAEKNFTNVTDLIAEINEDIAIAKRELSPANPTFEALRTDEFFANRNE